MATFWPTVPDDRLKLTVRLEWACCHS